MPRKQIKKKWVLAALLVLTVPAEASSPNLSNLETISPISATCGDKAIGREIGGTDDLTITYGSCTAGSDNCCYGFPEVVCDKGVGGGFEQM